MAKETKIQWADSTLNIQMGCEGCELVKGLDKPKCYAKVMTDRYAGGPGWPETFEKPKLFLERFPAVFGWPDLRGTKRIEKPWLNDRPRMIFLNDMGDTFSNGMPYDWFAEMLPKIAVTPHVYMVLTKWPKRFAEFSKRHLLPKNIMPGTTVTSAKTVFRVDQLAEVFGGGMKWLSIEPLWGEIKPRMLYRKEIPFLIFGGESGVHATPTNIEEIRAHVQFNDLVNNICFVKQLGSNVFSRGKAFPLKDFHGGNMDEWPEDLRVRQFPIFENKLFF